MNVNQDVLGLVELKDENGANTSVGVHYELKPVVCKQCFGMGHSAEECQKKGEKKAEWVVKVDNRPKPNAGNTKIDDEGFQQVTKMSKT